MPLYKSWLETRFRFLYVAGLFLIGLVVSGYRAETVPSVGKNFLGMLGLFWFMIPLMLAGTGVETQANFHPTRGLHGSTFFTLSLPVSRFRLLAVRSWLGILEAFVCIAAGCAVLWAAFPFLRAQWPLRSLLEYVLTVSVCLCGFYFLFVVFAALLADDFLRIWTSVAAIALLKWVSTAVHVSPSLNVFEAIGKASPLFTHVIPWTSMGVSIGASLIFFWVALKIVQAREY